MSNYNIPKEFLGTKKKDIQSKLLKNWFLIETFQTIFTDLKRSALSVRRRQYDVSKRDIIYEMNFLRLRIIMFMLKRFSNIESCHEDLS